MSNEQEYSKKLEEINCLLRVNGVLFRLRETITGQVTSEQLAILDKLHLRLKSEVVDA
jgi:hypothetical protein